MQLGHPRGTAPRDGPGRRRHPSRNARCCRRGPLRIARGDRRRAPQPRGAGTGRSRDPVGGLRHGRSGRAPGHPPGRHGAGLADRSHRPGAGRPDHTPPAARLRVRRARYRSQPGHGGARRFGRAGGVSACGGRPVQGAVPALGRRRRGRGPHHGGDHQLRSGRVRRPPGPRPRHRGGRRRRARRPAPGVVLREGIDDPLRPVLRSGPLRTRASRKAASPIPRGTYRGRSGATSRRCSVSWRRARWTSRT